MHVQLVSIESEIVTNVSSTDFPGHWPGEDHAWDLDAFRKTFSVSVTSNTPRAITFDLVHIDASIANAFRRICMAEVATLAIETVFVQNNTSVIQDEVLAQRLGLVPLTGNPGAIRAMTWYRKDVMPDGSDRPPTIDNTIVMKLNMECTRRPNAPKNATHPDELYENHSVYAKDLVFEPIGAQKQRFGDDPIRSANPDILLVKLRPGQVIECEMHAHKGYGKDHAKFSPVCTATYRLLPVITLKEEIRGKSAERLAKCFPRGVIEVVEGLAVVKRPRNDTVSREVLRHEEFKGKVQLGRVRDHFIFSVESTGQFDADYIFLEAVTVLQAKCERLKRHTHNMLKEQKRVEDRMKNEMEDASAMEE